MYQNYFGFKERPFQLVPNPAYLFLSRSHEEAMAHLTYATSQGDGFVAITGEVGTGKTTLCRAFIESLDKQTEVAYVFNPKLTAVELLRTICDEFGIDTLHCVTTKDLIDVFNRFLMAERARGKQVMLIIDEAQNLTREVLEQIRLLSNLETNTAKLLQIVLSGQPEMGDLLDTYELRQLGQRITLNCHLSPLTCKESVQYIQHRIRIAARNSGIDFSPSAFRKIYAFSNGIPRLIHIVCDRALLTAYVSNRHKITGNIVDKAIRELSARGDVGRLRALETRRTVLLAALLCLIVFLLFTVKPRNSGIPPAVNSPESYKVPTTPEIPVPPAPSQNIRSTVAPSPEISTQPETQTESSEPVVVSPAPADLPVNGVPASPLADYLAGIDSGSSKKTALAGALGLWGIKLPIKEYPDKDLIDPETYFNLTARENGFLIHRMQSSREAVVLLNLPAIFAFHLPGKSLPSFLTLDQIVDGKLSFMKDAQGNRIVAAPEEVDRLWSGIVYIPWINFDDFRGTTPISGPEKSIQTLKKLLGNIGYTGLAPNALYDLKTEGAVKDIQQKYGLATDGLVGPLTKIALYNEQPGLKIPHILGSDTTPRANEPKVAD